MATLSTTRSYDDGVILLEADLDAFLDDIETFLNVTKLNDDNIQNGGITGSTKLVNASVTKNKMAANSVGTTQLENDAVTNAKMATNSVDTDELVDNAVTTAKIIDNAVTTAKILDENITTAKLSSGSIVPSKFGAGNIAKTKKENTTTFTPTSTAGTWHSLASHAVTLTKQAEDSAVEVIYNPRVIFGDNTSGTVASGAAIQTGISYSFIAGTEKYLSVALFRNDVFVEMLQQSYASTFAIGLSISLDSAVTIVDTAASAGSCVYQIKYLIVSPVAVTGITSTNGGAIITAREVI